MEDVEIHDPLESDSARFIMTVYLVRPVANLDLADAEHRVKGLMGARISPSRCGIFVTNPSSYLFPFRYKDIVIHGLFASVAPEQKLKGAPKNPIIIQNLPDLPLRYPKMQTCFSKLVDRGQLDALGLTLRRSMGKQHAYFLAKPSPARVTLVSRQPNVLPGWAAPAGFANINTFRALVLVRRLFHGYIAAQDPDALVQKFSTWAEDYVDAEVVEPVAVL